MPHNPADFHGFQDGPRSILNRGPGPLPVYPVALEEEIEIQDRENWRIVADNHHLVDENVILQRDVMAAKDEIHRLDQVILKLRADKDAQTRDLIERRLKLEADLRATEPLREEVIRLRAEAQRLNALRQDLTAQIRFLSEDITRLRSENKELSALRADVDRMRKELTEARRALEYEKKANEELVVRKQSDEKNVDSMVCEIEKLRAEQLSMDRRAHGHGGVGSYGLYNGGPNLRSSGGVFDDGYGGVQWGPYSNHGPPRY